jgi:hypothetical protein
MSTKTKWKIYICAIEHTYEQASEDKARVLEISTPLELQPANYNAATFTRRAHADLLAREINSQRNGLLYHLTHGQAWMSKSMAYRAEARRV